MNNREQFESWVSDNGKFQRALERKGDIYLLATINTQWEAWQAASKASEQQLAAVVAENAGLKAAAEFATAPDMWIEQADGMLDYRYVDWYVDVLKAAMNSTATDAAIANIQAQGVDAAIERLIQKFEGTGHIGVPVMVLEHFAAQLRQGAAL